jgi:hypothetical protein
MDKNKTTSEEDFYNQLDYMIKVGILKEPKNVIKISDIETDWFKGLTKQQKDIEIAKATNDWWNYYGEEKINELYSDTIISSKDLRGDIAKYWIDFLEIEKDRLEKYLGIDAYKEQLKRNKTILREVKHTKKKSINELDVKLENYIKENGIDLSDKDIVKLGHLLHNRRLNGGCSMWKDVGIEYLYKHDKDKLYSFEIEWYEKNKEKNNE